MVFKEKNVNTNKMKLKELYVVKQMCICQAKSNKSLHYNNFKHSSSQKQLSMSLCYVEFIYRR